jgi:dethiobiotin synthetase
MRSGVFITGTDTGVGKTVVAAVLASAIQRRLQSVRGKSSVTVWKPVQTGVAMHDRESDSHRLVAGSGIVQDVQATATFTFPDPLAPWIAAQRVGETIPFQHLLNEGWERLRANDFTVIEGAGGLGVPITERHLVRDLVAALKIPLVIVARPGLGTVNHTLMTIAYAKAAGLEVHGVILNGDQTTERIAIEENAMMIERFGQVPILATLPWVPLEPHTDEEWSAWREHWAEVTDTALVVDRLLAVEHEH